MKRPAFFAVIAVVAATAVFVSARAPASDVTAPFEGEPEVVAATFASAWCSSCKILKPRLAKVVPDFASEPVKFVEYDFTFGDRKTARASAQADGVEAAFDQYENATGFTLLVDADTGDVIDILTMSYSEGAMRAAITQAVTIASRD